MTAVFIYSTGRCGTQWITRNFADNLGDEAEVVHEPLGAKWAPRVALRHPDLAALRREMPEIDRHFDHIAEILAAGRTYVETGWPAFAWYPYLKTMFGDRLRWVHLVRNPIYVAASMVTLGCYDPDSETDRKFAELALLQPTDRGVIFNALVEQWASLTQFEKCLFQWLEINRYAVSLTNTPGLEPACVLRFEDAFNGDPRPLRQMFQAVGFPEPSVLKMKPLDRFQRRAPVQPEVTSKRLWQDVASVGHHFGYESDQLHLATQAEAVLQRYSRAGRGRNIVKAVRRAVVKTVRRAVKHPGDDDGRV